MVSNTPKPKTPEEEIVELSALIDLASSLAVIKGNQGQLIIMVNRLQSDKLVTDDDKADQSSHDPITTAARHGHKLMFLTYDGMEDPLPLLNRCM
jgi:hypothetical protein